MSPVKYTIESLDDLDTFDSDSALNDSGFTGEFEVFCQETQTWYTPSWCIRSNGDIDGLEGWNEK